MEVVRWQGLCSFSLYWKSDVCHGAANFAGANAFQPVTAGMMAKLKMAQMATGRPAFSVRKDGKC
jgi:hypothetical protein